MSLQEKLVASTAHKPSARTPSVYIPFQVGSTFNLLSVSFLTLKISNLEPKLGLPTGDVLEFEISVWLNHGLERYLAQSWIQSMFPRTV